MKFRMCVLHDVPKHYVEDEFTTPPLRPSSSPLPFSPFLPLLPPPSPLPRHLQPPDSLVTGTCCDKLISSHPPNTQWHYIYIYILIIIMHMYNNHLLYNQFKTNAALFYLEKVVYEHLFLSLPFFYSLPSNAFSLR